MTGMARRLNALGHCTQRRMPWSIASVRRLLYREGLNESYRFPGRVPLCRMTAEQHARAVIAGAATRRAMSAIADAPISAGVVEGYALGRSCRELARGLNAKGILRRRGREWTGGAIRLLLRRAGVQLRPPMSDMALHVQPLAR
jgi:hypothetical protein